MPDPVLLSRLQFFWVISFHILLPAFTVGLACYIAVLETLYLKTGDPTYFRVSVFWTRIFAVSFRASKTLRRAQRGWLGKWPHLPGMIWAPQDQVSP